MLQRFGETIRAGEVKFAPVDLKSVEADGSFSGYASVFGEVDLGQDLVMPGAFRESLSSRGARGVKLLFQHDPNEPIGVWLELHEDGKGLFARGRLMPEVSRAREVLSLMRAGALDGLSIGFRTVKGRTDPKSGVRRLDKIDLWEISIVTFPMLPEARVSAVKRRGAELSVAERAGYARLAHVLRRGAAVMRAR
jgi:HK97 family phage prohead protease